MICTLHQWAVYKLAFVMLITVTPKSNDTDNTVIYVAIAIGVLLAIVIIVAVVLELKIMKVKGGQPADSAAASEEGSVPWKTSFPRRTCFKPIPSAP